MAKYHGSPWGYLRGKLDDAVGGVWKGINWSRVRIYPTQRGTLDKYRALKAGIIPLWMFSFKQMNIRRAVFQVLGYIGRRHQKLWCQPIWGDFVKRRALTMTAINAFVFRNAARLYGSIPDRTLEFDPATNAPDLLQMLVSDGDLEPTSEVVSAVYTALTGTLVVTFKPEIYENGLGTDIVFVVVAKKPLLESVGEVGTWYPSLYLYPFNTGKPRVDGVVTVMLPMGLPDADLIAYVFFADVLQEIGFSASVAKQVTKP